MLQNNISIEGLSEWTESESFDDTPPGSVITRFSVESEDMPFLSNEAGKRITKNFIHVSRTWELGRSSYRRRIKDEVKYNESTGKWEIVRLANEQQSDTRKNPNEWNAFMRGISIHDTGNPLVLLFPHDPSRVEFYKDAHIITIEQLAGQNDSDIQSLGNGVRADVEKAKRWISKSNEEIPEARLKHELSEKDRKIESLQNQLEDLSAKLTELLKQQIEEEKPRRGRPRKEQVEEQAGE